MPWELETRDGIVIRNIPDDVKADDPRLKERVTQLRSSRTSEPVSRGASGSWGTPGASGAWDANTPQARAERGVSGIVRGLRDPVDAIYQAAAHAGLTSTPAAEVDQAIAEREAQYQTQRAALGGEGFDALRTTGNVVATLPLAAIPGGGAGLLARTAAGAATGAVASALQPVAEGDFWTEKGKQAGLGAAFGGAAAPVAGAISRVIRPNTPPEVQLLMREGVTPTPGQIAGGFVHRAEDKLRSLPIVGDAITAAQRSGVEDLNRALYGRALAPIGGTVPREVGRGGVAQVKQQLSQAYNNLLPRLSFKADPQWTQELATARQMASAGLPPAQAQRFEQVLQNSVLGKMTPQGNASGETVKAIESELGRLSSGYRKDPSIDNRMLGDALQEVQAMIRRGLARGNPQHADELARINEGYAVYARIRDAASRQGSAEGVMTPGQLSAAVRAGDKSVGKGAYATGQAPLQDLSDAARTVLGPSYPDSGTAGRLMLGLGAGGGAAMIEPSLLTGAAAASLPYLPIARNVVAALFTNRGSGQTAATLADAIRRGLPPAVALGAPPVVYGQ
jgi:hypothetical protein